MIFHVSAPEVIIFVAEAGRSVSKDEDAKFAPTQRHIHPFVIIHKSQFPICIRSHIGNDDKISLLPLKGIYSVYFNIVGLFLRDIVF